MPVGTTALVDDTHERLVAVGSAVGTPELAVGSRGLEEDVAGCQCSAYQLDRCNRQMDLLQPDPGHNFSSMAVSNRCERADDPAALGMMAGAAPLVATFGRSDLDLGNDWSIGVDQATAHQG